MLISIACLPSVAYAQRAQYRLVPQCPLALDSLRVSSDVDHPTDITGRVTSRDTGRPVTYASVKLTPGNKTAFADSLGAFRFTSLSARQYVLEFKAIGYARQNDTVTIGSPAGVTINVPLVPQYAERCPTMERVRIDSLGRAESDLP